jgi:Protein of unknown function (DUF2924)
MPRTKIAQPNHPAARPPRARRGRSAAKAVKEHATQGKIGKSRQCRSDHATSKPSKLLGRRDDASIEELQTATGWQPDSVRRVLVRHGQEEARADARCGSAERWPPALPCRTGDTGMVRPGEIPPPAHLPRPSTTCISAVAARLEALLGMDIADLRAEWRRHLRSSPPNRLSRDLLMRGIAYKIQERGHGGLTRATVRQLQALAEQLAAGDRGLLGPYPSLKPGTRLLRSWGGETHSVLTLDGGFEYRGAHFRSLSQIARTITGVRWSGPRFFGLTRRSKPFARLVEADHG